MYLIDLLLQSDSHGCGVLIVSELIDFPQQLGVVGEACTNPPKLSEKRAAAPFALTCNGSTHAL